MTKKKKVTEFNEKKDVKGIICIVLGLLILLSLMSIFFENSSPGLIGMIVRKLFFSLFGIGAYLLPFILFFIGICYISKNGEVEYNKNFYISIAIIINTLILLSMITYSSFYNKSFVEVVKKFYNCTHIFHGGLLSYFIIVPVKYLLGSLGVYIINVAIYLICCIMIFNFTINDIVSKLKIKRKRPKERIAKEKFKRIEISPKENKIDDAYKKENGENTIKILKGYTVDGKDEDTPQNEDNIIYNNSFQPSASDASVNLEKENIYVYTTEVQDTELNYSEERSNDNPVTDGVTDEKKVKINTDYLFPSIDLLKDNIFLKNEKTDKRELMSSGLKLKQTLKSFGVNVTVNHIIQGPAVTRYEIQPESGVKVSKIVNLADDIALNLAASGIRIEAPIPGKAAIGIEVPNQTVVPVFIKEMIESDTFKTYKGNIGVCLGKDIAGNVVLTDLSKMPHLLVAGATGSGKSVCINTLITSLLYKYSPKEVNLLLIDPKVVELSIYNGIPHLLIPVVTDPKKAAGALNWAVTEMARRYNLFAENGARNIEGYNQLKTNNGEEKLPYTVIIIDELADLMMVCPKDVEDYIARLAQMARAAGMHLVIATQRPSVDVITGTIKANIPSRISFSVSSQIDSRTILDSSGAEKLLGKGDMLFYPVGEAKPIRIQGAFISEEEVESIVSFIKNQTEEVKYDEEIIAQIHNNTKDDTSKPTNEAEDTDDPLVDEAIEYVVKSGYASASMLQRKFKIGYNRAARIVDTMEEQNIISGRNGSKPRDILMNYDNLDK